MKSEFLLRFIFTVFFFYTISGYAQVSNKEQTKPASSGSNGYHHFKAWLTTGNSGTNPYKNFIGTMDARPLVFRVNNQKAGFIDNNLSSSNTSFGYQTLNSNVVSSTSGKTGSYNSAFGYGALLYNVTGEVNTAHGAGALLSNTQGNVNTAVGGFALQSNTTGAFNSATGAFTLVGNTTGSFNTGYGAYVLAGNQTGNFNTAVGTPFTLSSSTEGSENTAVGSVAMGSNTTGNANVAYGVFTLAANKTGNNNTAIGYKADVAADNLTNATAVGNGALVDASNKVRIGNDDVTSIGGKVGWTNYSDERIKDEIKENVPGLSFINALRPVTYHISIAKENALLGKKEMRMDAFSTSVNKRPELTGVKGIGTKEFQKLTAKEWQSNPAKINNESEKIQYTGFLAQEVDKAAQNLGYDFSGIDKTGKIMGLRYSDFVVPLVKAVQELSKENEALKQANQNQQQQIAELRHMVLDMKIGSNTVTSMSGYLEQNTPNPVSGATTIGYHFSETATAARLDITNAKGQMMKTITIPNKGTGLVSLNMDMLASGTYNYTLYVDGKQVDTKRLVIAR